MATQQQQERIVRDLRDRVDDRDVSSSATLQSMDDLAPHLRELQRRKDGIDTVLDLGCGYGALTSYIADLVEAEVVHGIDLDEERRAVAEQRGLRTHDLDLNEDRFPFEDESVDLVLSFGVLEHLEFFDNAISESRRVLRPGGHLLVSVPNLSSWLNRLVLLCGYQPRDVEISTVRGFGVPDQYPTDQFLNHVHAPTYRAFVELLEHYGFGNLDVRGLHPYQPNKLVELIDRVAARRPSLSRRIVVLGQRVE